MLQPTTKSQALSEADFSGIASSTSTARLSYRRSEDAQIFAPQKLFKL